MIYSIYISGYFILFTAIIANIIAAYFNLLTWYDFIKYLHFKGLKKTIFKIKIIDCVWLFLIYPILLSYGYRAGLSIVKIINNMS